MDILAGIQLPPEKDFDRITAYRAEKHEELRGRNNVTSCRSPTREINTRLLKNELKEKRHAEFLRRRSMSPELCGLKPKKRHSPSSKLETLHTNTQTFLTVNGRPKMTLTTNSSATDDPCNSTWVLSQSEQVTLMRQEKKHSRRQVSASTPVMTEPNPHRMKSTAQKASIKNFITTENIHRRFSQKTETTVQKKTVREASVQTEFGFVTVNESHVQRLADYLQEALWREEAVKKKMAALQESTSNLMNSTKQIWTTRCSEDLLRNKIKALEAQLQACLQKFPRDGVKKLVVQMEKQKLMYEEKALVALQKATQEKTEALTKAETLQESLITSKAEALKWQSLYEELKLRSGQLRENHHFSNDQLQQLHSKLELSQSKEAELQEDVVSLRQEKKELLYNICLLEEDNQVLREEIHHLRDGDSESQDITTRGCLTITEPQLTTGRNSQVQEELRHTQEKLQLKEKECEELQTELRTMEHECQSTQARLSQCRDELRQLSHHRRRPPAHGSWWRVCVFFLLLLLTVACVVMLWLWHPPFREQVEDLYLDVETRIEDYLLEMASPQHSGCFRPI